MPIQKNKFIPDLIKVASREVRVQIVDAPMIEGQRVMGFFDPDKQLIVLDGSISSPDVFMETFWHELVHAINDFVRFDVELMAEMRDKDSVEQDAFNFQETFTERFSTTLLQVIKDNNLLPI